jgi:hypothetical protein
MYEVLSFAARAALTIVDPTEAKSGKHLAKYGERVSSVSR